MESRVCTVVDVSRWKRLLNAMRELFVGQTERADVVLMNKADLVSEDVLRTVEKDIAEMNPNARGSLPQQSAMWRNMCGIW